MLEHFTLEEAPSQKSSPGIRPEETSPRKREHAKGEIRNGSFRISPFIHES